MRIAAIFTIFSFLGFGPHLHELIHHFHEADHQHQLSCFFEQSEKAHFSEIDFSSSQSVSAEKCFVLQHLIQAQKFLMKGNVLVANVSPLVLRNLSQKIYRALRLARPFLDEKQSRAPPYSFS